LNNNLKLNWLKFEVKYALTGELIKAYVVDKITEMLNVTPAANYTTLG